MEFFLFVISCYPGRIPMVKGFAPSCGRWDEALFFFNKNGDNSMNNQSAATTLKQKAIIAVRKRKDASGTGLSHYILIEKPSLKKEAH